MQPVAAFFDMDRTLLRCSTGSRWIRYLRERGEIDTPTLLKSLWWIVQYKLAILDMETVATRLVADMAGQSEQDLRDKAQPFLARDGIPEVAQRGRERIEEPRQQERLLVLLTSSPPYVAEPLAEHLGLDHVLCTRLHVQDGRFLGTCDRPTCYGEGKVY